MVTSVNIFEFTLNEYLFSKYDIIDRVTIECHNVGTVKVINVYETNIWLKYVDNKLNDDIKERTDIRNDVKLVAKLVNFDGLNMILFSYSTRPPFY